MRNVGNVDRGIRVILGIASIALGYFVAETTLWMWIWYAVAAILFITALVTWCPIWRLFRISTYRKATV